VASTGTLLDIWNFALDEIAEKSVVNTETNAGSSPFVKKLARRWEGVARGALEQYPFNFAIVREELNRAAPAIIRVSHDYVYDLPARALRTEGYTYAGADDYPVSAVVENGYVVSNSDSVWATFVSADFVREDYVGRWSQLFCDWMGWRMAQVIAPATLDPERMKRIDAMTTKSWSDVTVTDAQQSPKRIQRTESSWNQSRDRPTGRGWRDS